MKKPTFFLGLCILVVLAITLGCKERRSYFVKLMDEESIFQGSTVYLDNQPIATVVDIMNYEGETVAKIQLTNDKYSERMLTGTLRTAKKNSVYLTTSNVKPDALPLLEDSIIFPQNQIEFITHKWATRWNVIGIIGALVVLAILIFILKNLLRFFVLAVCIVLALFTAYYLYPYGVPYVEKIYKYLPDNGFSKTTVQTIDKQTNSEEALDKFAEKMKIIIKGAPNPKYISFALLFIISLIIYSIILNIAIPPKQH
jgi:hypothetical protein